MTDLIDAHAVAELAGVKVRTIYLYKQQERMPPPTTTFGQAPVWDRAEIEQWVKDRKTRTTTTTTTKEYPNHG